MRAPRRAGAAALLAAALAAGGCGEDRGELTSTETTAAPASRPPPPRATPPAAEVSLRETEYRLDPAQIRVDRPATLAIRVRNAGDRPHALAVEGHSVTGRTRTVEPGGSEVLRVELRRPGRYRWYCPVDGHARRGMTGTIAVARGR